MQRFSTRAALTAIVFMLLQVAAMQAQNTSPPVDTPVPVDTPIRPADSPPANELRTTSPRTPQPIGDVKPSKAALPTGLRIRVVAPPVVDETPRKPVDDTVAPPTKPRIRIPIQGEPAQIGDGQQAQPDDVNTDSKRSHSSAITNQILALDIEIQELRRSLGKEHPAVVSALQRRQILEAFNARTAQRTANENDPTSPTENRPEIPPGMRVVTVEVKPNVKRLLQPGDHIDVHAVVVNQDKLGPNRSIELVAENLAVFATDQENDRATKSDHAYVSLLVPPESAKQILLAANRGELHVVIRAGAAADPRKKVVSIVRGADVKQLLGQVFVKAVEGGEREAQIRLQVRRATEAGAHAEGDTLKKVVRQFEWQTRPGSSQESQQDAHLERLQHAQKSLHAAGLREMADDVSRQIESILRDKQLQAARRREPGRELSLHDEIREMRREVRELRMSIQQLHRMLDRRAQSGAGGGATDLLDTPKPDVDNADATVNFLKTGLVVYEAPWCGPCRSMKPILDKLSAEGFEIQHINIEYFPGVARERGIKSLPTFHVLRDGKVHAAVVGVTSESRLRSLLNDVETAAKTAAQDKGQPRATANSQSPASADAPAGMPPKAVPAVNRYLKIARGRSQLIVTKANITRTQIGKDGVVGLVQLTPREFSLVGIAEGKCSLLIWLEGSKVPLHFVVEIVKPDKRSAVELGDTLIKPVSLHFEDASLANVSSFLAQAAGCSIVLDKLGLEEVGISPTQSITVNVDGISLKSALNLILKPHDLGYVFEDEVLKITSRERSEGSASTISYAVSDLLPGRRPGQKIDESTFQSLIELVTSTIAPDSWSTVGGSANIAAFPKTQSVIVRANQQTHSQLQNLLTMLRRHVAHGFEKRVLEDEAPTKSIAP